MKHFVVDKADWETNKLVFEIVAYGKNMKEDGQWSGLIATLINCLTEWKSQMAWKLISEAVRHFKLYFLKSLLIHCACHNVLSFVRTCYITIESLGHDDRNLLSRRLKVVVVSAYCPCEFKQSKISIAESNIPLGCTSNI